MGDPQGVISAGTLHLVAQLRSRGALFVVISGARLSTLLMRLPYLPAADAYVCENGGRILYPGSDLPTGEEVKGSVVNLSFEMSELKEYQQQRWCAARKRTERMLSTAQRLLHACRDAYIAHPVEMVSCILDFSHTYRLAAGGSGGIRLLARSRAPSTDHAT